MTVATLWNVSLTLEPSVRTLATISTAITEAIKPYSTAVTAALLIRKFRQSAATFVSMSFLLSSAVQRQ